MTSGPQHPPAPGYGQQPPAQWPPHPPYPPSGGRGRRSGWIVAVVAVVAVLAGGTFAGLAVFGDSDDSASSAEDPSPSDEPTGPAEPTDDPAEPEPTEPVTASDPWGSLPADAEISQVSDAVAAAGYACFDSLAEPVLVRRCFLEPATSSLDDQVVSIEAEPDGSVNAVDVTVDYFDGNRKSEPMFVETLNTLEGTLLTRSEIRAIVAGQRPERHSRQSLAWGSAELFTSEAGRAYHLEMVAKGRKAAAIPAGDTGISVAEVKARYTGEGFSCTVDSALNTLRCERRAKGGAMAVLAFDECLRHKAKFASICKGHKVSSLTATAEFDSGMPESAYGKFFHHLRDGILLAAADDWSPEAEAWIDSHLDLKRHRADFDGMHIEVMPHTGEVVGGFEQAYQVSVQGINVDA
jgi:hypothetical protein